MGPPELRPAPGRLETVARTVEEAQAAVAIALDAAGTGPRHARFVELAGTRCYFKLSALAGKTRLRYALKRGLLRRKLPRLREFENLGWLRAHGFHAPEPIAAGALWRGGLPRFQFLFTREVPRARTLAEVLAEPAPDVGRAEILDRLAREVARMHALGFVHHDLFPRNLLVAARPDPLRIWFLDCWAGGPPPQLRGPGYDLACVAGEDGWLDGEERERFLETYASARRPR